MRRTRLIRPEFFDDEVIAAFPVTTRLFYIGLWTLCDDRGYFDRRPAVIAAAIFPYDGHAKRLRATESALHQLEDATRIRWLDCGKHGIVPTLERHSGMGGKKSSPVADRHDKECLLTVIYGTSPEGTGLPPSSLGIGSSLGQGSSKDQRERRPLAARATEAS